MRSSSLITHSFLWLSLLTNKIISILLSPKTAKHLQSNLGIELENSIQQTVNSVYSSWTTKATPFLNPLQINHIIDAYQELNEHYDIRICGGFQHQCDYNLLIFSRADPMKVFTTQGQDSSSSSQSNNPLLLSSLTLEESAEYATGIRIVGTSALELFTHRDLLAAIKTDLNLTIGTNTYLN